MSDFRVPRVLELQSLPPPQTPPFTGAVRRDNASGAAYNSSVLVRPDGRH